MSTRGYKERQLAELLGIHPKNPQPRLIKQAVTLLQKGGILILPTDSGYSLGCALGQKDAVLRIRQIRQLDEKHFFTLLCRDFAEIAVYAEINNLAFRFLKAHTPAPITFILPATKQVPKRLLHPSRRTVGVRIPQNAITLALLTEFAAPLMSVSVGEFEETWPLLDPEEIFLRYHKLVDIIINGGVVTEEPTTIVSFTDGVPEIIRQGSYVI